MSEIINYIEAINNMALGKKVSYGKGDLSDHNDQSNKWIQIVKSDNDKYLGDLVRVSTRHTIEHEIEGEFYYEFNLDQIGLIIKKRNVKESILKPGR